MKKKWLLMILLLIIMMTMTGCLPGNPKYSLIQPAGFLSGIWHGWLAPLTLFLSLFMDNIHMYEVHNSGFFYDLGFYMAIISGFGGLSLNRKRKKKKK